jgi:hypothetical protein
LAIVRSISLARPADAPTKIIEKGHYGSPEASRYTTTPSSKDHTAYDDIPTKPKSVQSAENLDPPLFARH